MCDKCKETQNFASDARAHQNLVKDLITSDNDHNPKSNYEQNRRSTSIGKRDRP
jgi:hypothetical protein